MLIDFNKIKSDFPQVDSEFEGKKITYLDSAATNLRFRGSVEAITRYYSFETANVHRGIHKLSEMNTHKYEETRDALKNLFNAKNRAEIIFTKGTTDSINLIAKSWGEHNIKQHDEIIISELEHHSNIVPWQMLCEKTGAKLKVIPVNDKGELEIEEFSKLLTDKTKLVAINYISNALGTINPINKIITLTKAKTSAKVLIDAAQAASHKEIDVQKLDIDFMAISAHKMFGPTGVGALYGKLDLLESMPPLMGGGAMIDKVSFEKTTYLPSPEKFEAGTPHIAGVIGWKPAIDYICDLGFEAIEAHEKEILDYATQEIEKLSNVKIIGTANEKSGVLSFTMKDIHPHDIATIANKYGVAIRTGHHCTQPLMKRFGVPATARASFSIYNTREDVDKLISTLKKITELFC